MSAASEETAQMDSINRNLVGMIGAGRIGHAMAQTLVPGGEMQQVGGPLAGVKLIRV
jgi:phosphoglycerate dehydrogenase-like enzyme